MKGLSGIRPCRGGVVLVPGDGVDVVEVEVVAHVFLVVDIVVMALTEIRLRR